MYGSFQGRLQDLAGDAQAEVEVTVVVAPGSSTPAQIYGWSGGVFAELTAGKVTTDALGYYTFYARPGIYEVQLPPNEPLMAVVAPPGVPYLYPDAMPYDVSGLADDTDRLQDAIDALSSYKGGGGTGGMVLLGARRYLVSTLVCPDDVTLMGQGASLTVLEQLPGATGPVIRSLAAVGSDSSVGGKHAIRHLGIDGADQGVLGQASVTGMTSGSDVLTVNKTVADVLHAMVEGVGVSPGTFVTAVSGPPGKTLTLSQSCMLTNPQPAPTLIFRKGIKLEVTARDTESVTCADVTGVTVGMRAAALFFSQEDIWVTEVDDTTNTITFHRPIDVNNNSTALYVYVYNCGVHAGEPEYFFDPEPPGAEPIAGRAYRGPTLADVAISRCSGDGVLCRSREQLHITQGCRISDNAGYGVRATGLSDSQADGGSVFDSNWRANYHVNTSATPRFVGCTFAGGRNPQSYADLEVQGCRQVHVLGGAVHGRVWVKGNSEESHHGLRFSGVSFTWLAQTSVPATEGAFITLDVKAQLTMEAPQFALEGSSRPERLWQVVDADSTVLVNNLRLKTDAAPYTTALATPGAKVWGSYWDATSSQWVPLGNQALWGVTDASLAPMGAVGEVLQDTSTIISMAHDQISEIASVALPAGDWECSAVVQLAVSTGECSQAIASVGVQSGVLAPGPVGLAQNDALKGMTAGSTAMRLPLQVAPFRLNQATAGTLYLHGAVKLNPNSGPTVTMQGVLWARRVR